MLFFNLLCWNAVNIQNWLFCTKIFLTIAILFAYQEYLLTNWWLHQWYKEHDCWGQLNTPLVVKGLMRPQGNLKKLRKLPCNKAYPGGLLFLLSFILSCWRFMERGIIKRLICSCKPFKVNTKGNSGQLLHENDQVNVTVPVQPN